MICLRRLSIDRYWLFLEPGCLHQEPPPPEGVHWTHVKVDDLEGVLEKVSDPDEYREYLRDRGIDPEKVGVWQRENDLYFLADDGSDE